MTIQSIRRGVYQLLDPQDQSTTASLSANFVIVLVVFVSVIAMAMETDSSLAMAHAQLFWVIELSAVIFFAVEYVARWWSIIESDQHLRRRDYLLSADALIDLVAILPFFFGLVYGLDLRIFIVFRLFRLFKLFRYFAPLMVMASVMRAEARSFVSALLVMLVLVFLTATGIYFFEHEQQPDVLGSIPKAMWWAIVTLTTLGYGDVIPITPGGRVFAGLMTVFAVGIVALPAGMLASRFSEELQKRKTEYTRLAAQLKSESDGTFKDCDQLEMARQRLCLSRTDAQHIEQHVRNGSKSLESTADGQKTCPKCGHQL